MKKPKVMKSFRLSEETLKHLESLQRRYPQLSQSSIISLLTYCADKDITTDSNEFETLVNSPL